ncbi:hypothetical protein FOZ62_019788, partial [Perkinsus olseni]
MLLEGRCEEASLHKVRVAGTLPRGRPRYTQATALQTDDSYIRRHLALPRHLGLNADDVDAPPLPEGARAVTPGSSEPTERSRLQSFIQDLSTISVSADDGDSSGDEDDPQRALHRALIESAEQEDDGRSIVGDDESSDQEASPLAMPSPSAMPNPPQSPPAILVTEVESKTVNASVLGDSDCDSSDESDSEEYEGESEECELETPSDSEGGSPDGEGGALAGTDTKSRTQHCMDGLPNPIAEVVSHHSPYLNNYPSVPGFLEAFDGMFTLSPYGLASDAAHFGYLRAQGLTGEENTDRPQALRFLEQMYNRVGERRARKEPMEEIQRCLQHLYAAFPRDCSSASDTGSVVEPTDAQPELDAPDEVIIDPIRLSTSMSPTSSTPSSSNPTTSSLVIIDDSSDEEVRSPEIRVEQTLDEAECFRDHVWPATDKEELLDSKTPELEDDPGYRSSEAHRGLVDNLMNKVSRMELEIKLLKGGKVAKPELRRH